MHLERRSKIAGAAIALLALTGLGLRYGLFLSQAWDSGLSTWQATGNFYSYFTVLANGLVVLAFTAPGSFFRNAQARASVTLYIAVVGLVYELMLRGIWHPEGAEFFASLILHDAVPLAVLAHWLLLREKGALRWTHPFGWLWFPIAYLAYAVLRGEWTGWWLYPFIDASALGHLRAALNAAALIALFLLLGMAMVAWDRRRSGRPAARAEVDADEDELEFSGA